MALQSTTTLATITLQSASSEVVFSGIPANYRDLILISEMKTLSSTASAYLKFNGISANYSTILMRGNGSDTVSSNAGATTDRLFIAYSTEPTTSNATNSIVQIIDYSATEKHKTILQRSNNAADAVEALVGRYASTAPITSITVGMDSSLSFAAGSTFSLYGVIA
jgi:hypothetical protein